MEEDLAIRIKGLSKKYYLSDKKTGLSFSEQVKNIFFSGKSDKQAREKGFYALKDINLTIKKGEAIGIIGRNGAGKSTLLKILSEVVEPTEGTIEINGSVASVLEIGMGFHPDLTGKENVYLSGAMLGIPKKKLKEIFNEIVSFSGIENFIDTPVKHYSSGMYLRLAFSVVAHLDTDILLFDETLSTGDIAFQLKCYERIDSLVNKGKTVLLVSHNLNDIIRISTRIIYLENGQLKADSQANSLDVYLKDSIASNSLFDHPQAGMTEQYTDTKVVEFDATSYASINEDIRIKKIVVCAVNKSIEQEVYIHDTIELSVEYYKQKDEDFFDIGFTFSYLNSMIIYVHALNSYADIKNHTAKGNYTAKVLVPPHFFNDVNLQIGVTISKNNREIIFAYKKFLNIKLHGTSKQDNEYLYGEGRLPKFIGPIFPKWEWSVLNIDN